MAMPDSKESDSLVAPLTLSNSSDPPIIRVGDNRPPDIPTSSPTSTSSGVRVAASSPSSTSRGMLPPLQRSISEKGSREHVALLPPEITYDTVATAPNSPTDIGLMGGSAFAGFNRATHGMESRSTSVTPSGSLLCVSKPIELRESTLTINYPDTGGECSFIARMLSLHVVLFVT